MRYFFFCFLLVPVLGHAQQTCLGLFLKDETLLTDNNSVYTVEDIRLDLEALIQLREGDKHHLAELQAQRLGEHVLQVQASRQVDTVLYPLGGYDAGPAFLLFPTATTIISIDQHRFVSERYYTQKIPITPKMPHTYNVRFALFSQVDTQETVSHMVSAQVASLKITFPKVRIHRVAELRTVNGGSSHGWIDFDLGEGTPLRRYIHIDETYSEYSRWITPLTKHGYEGLILKGSMEIFTKGFESPGAPLLHHIEERQGLVVDTDGKLWSEVEEFYPVENQSFKDSFRVEGMTFHFTDIELGYDRNNKKRQGVKVVEFKL